MVSEAWKKGYRLGVQESSDHLGVHTAYSMILEPRHSRKAQVEAIGKRRTYGATDNITVDFRLRKRLMGAGARVGGPARFQVRIDGAEPG